MAIIVDHKSTPLRWSDFTPSAARMTDPADGKLVEAYTSFLYAFENKRPRKVGDRFAFPDPWRLTISPIVTVWSGVARTNELLAHEQFHYDVGVVCGRALARELSTVRMRTEVELRTFFVAAVKLHFHTRAGLIQSRYDRETEHGTNARAQQRWKQQMARCLANPNAQMLGGWWL